MSLIQTRFSVAEYKRSLWKATIPAGLTLGALEDPGFWAHVAAQIKPFDRIEAQAEDGTFWCELLVIKVDKSSVYTKPITLMDFSKPAKAKSSNEDDAPFEVAFRGPRKWSIVRKTDRQIMAEDIDTREDATIRAAKMAEELAALA